MAAALAWTAAAQQPALTKVIGFLTDFDVKDDAVGICKAVMDGIAPGVRVIDITHQSEPYNIAMGAELTIPRKGLKVIDRKSLGKDCI